VRKTGTTTGGENRRADLLLTNRADKFGRPPLLPYRGDFYGSKGEGIQLYTETLERKGDDRFPALFILDMIQPEIGHAIIQID
jgi:hypothetical protein